MAEHFSSVGSTPLDLRRRAGAAQGLTIAIAAFFPIMAIVSLAPAVPSMLLHFQGTSGAMTLVPLMVTAPGIMVTLLSPLAGWATDRYGRRLIILAATLLYGFLGVAPFFLDQLQYVFATRLGVGVTEAVILTVTNTLIGDYFHDAERRKWLTVQGIIGPVFSIAVIATAGMLTAWKWNGAFLIYFVAFAVFAAMASCLYEPEVVQRAKVAPDSAARQPFPWRVAITCCAVTLFTAILYYIFIVQGGLAFGGIGIDSPDRLGGLIAIAAIGVPLGAILFGLLSKRWPVKYLIATYLAFFGMGMIGMGLAVDYRVMTAFAFLQQIGAGMAVVTLIYWISNVIPGEHRGKGMGMWVGSFFAGQFVSPLVFGVAQSLSGGVLPAFLAMGVVGVAGGLIASVVRGRRIDLAAKHT